MVLRHAGVNVQSSKNGASHRDQNLRGEEGDRLELAISIYICGQYSGFSSALVTLVSSCRLSYIFGAFL